MTRLILTFDTVFKVMAADRTLRSILPCRPTPTPAGLSTSICGVSIEILSAEDLDRALLALGEADNMPAAVHRTE